MKCLNLILVLMNNPTDFVNSYDMYIVEGQQTKEGNMKVRECPLCHEHVTEPEGWRPTVFISHLSTAKGEHEPLTLLCDCGHDRLSHWNSTKSNQLMGTGPCSFSKTCGCREFRPKL